MLALLFLYNCYNLSVKEIKMKKITIKNIKESLDCFLLLLWWITNQIFVQQLEWSGTSYLLCSSLLILLKTVKSCFLNMFVITMQSTKILVQFTQCKTFFFLYKKSTMSNICFCIYKGIIKLYRQECITGRKYTRVYMKFSIRNGSTETDIC